MMPSELLLAVACSPVLSWMIRTWPPGKKSLPPRMCMSAEQPQTLLKSPGQIEYQIRSGILGQVVPSLGVSMFPGCADRKDYIVFVPRQV